MDSKEYKIRLEEIMTLIANNQFKDAVEIADRIDWREVKSFGTLEKISNLYKVNRRFDDAYEIAEYAYDYNHRNSNIVYNLCELSIERNNLIQAMKLLATYRELAPNNPASYILEYRIKELGNATLEEKIDILEEYKHKDFKQEWVYQLAYLYHRVGLATKCVETCDELITMFGDGPFVIKAMELKMLHTPLSKRQKEIYDKRNSIQEEIEAVESDEYTAEQPEPGLMPELGDEDFHVKTIDMSKFNTINLQKELADSMREILEADDTKKQGSSKRKRKNISLMDDEDPFLATDQILSRAYEVEELAENPDEQENYSYDDYSEDNYSEDNYLGNNYSEDNYQEDGYSDEVYTEDGYSDGSYVEDGYSEDNYSEDNYSYDSDANDNYAEDNYTENSYEEDNYTENSYTKDNYSESSYADDNYADNDYSEEKNEVFFDDKTGDIIIDQAPFGMMEDIVPRREGKLKNKDTGKMSEDEIIAYAAAQLNAAVGKTGKIRINDINSKPSKGNTSKLSNTMPLKGNTSKLSNTMPLESGVSVSKPVIRTVPRVEVENTQGANDKNKNDAATYGRKGKFDDILAQENDGQISLAIPQDANANFEKQITGQMNFQEVISSWKDIKKQQEKKQKEFIENKVLESTGKIFERFENGVSNGILEQIEEEERQNKRLIKNDLELHKIDDFIYDDGSDDKRVSNNKEYPGKSYDNKVYANKADANNVNNNKLYDDEEKKPFDATTELNRIYDSSLWDELDRVIAKDKENEKLTKESIQNQGNTELSDAEALDAEVLDAEALDAEVLNAEVLNTDVSNTEISDNEHIEEIEDAQNQEYAEETEEVQNQEYAEADLEFNSETEYNDNYDSEYDENYDSEYDENYDSEYNENCDSEYNENCDSEYNENCDSEYNESYNSEYAENYDSEYSENSDESCDEESFNKESYNEESFDEESSYGMVSLNTAQINDIGSVLEADADRVLKATEEEINDNYNIEEERDFSPDEQALFADFMYSKKMRDQILEAVDLVSLASYVGNVIITGDRGTGAIELAKALIKEIQLIDANFISQKVAKISGNKMNNKDVVSLFSQLSYGALIIEKAGEMKKETLENITMALENSAEGILVIITDTKKAIDKMVDKYGALIGYFNVRVDITPMNDNALVEYAKKYAYFREYKIDDERAVLALHQRISELQIGDHHVTTAEVEGIVDDAINHSRRPSIMTIFNIVSGKRYDYEDMIILQERDFN